MNDSSEDKPDQSHNDKTVSIIVNGRPKEVARGKVTYEQIVNLAFNNNPPTGENVVINVTYSKGEDRKEGSLLPGKDVTVKEGMIFDATATDKS